MNSFLLEQLGQNINQALKQTYNIELSIPEIQLQPTRKEFQGDITWVIFPLTRFSKKSPEITGTELGDALMKTSMIESFEVVKGFLNLRFKEEIILEEFYKSLNNPSFGMLAPKSEKIMVEFSSPNTNKPLHLGHVRNNLLGYSVSKILEAAGYEVIKTCLVNDRGIHICKSMVAYDLFGEGETPQSARLKGDHLVGKYYVRFEQELKKEIEGPISQGMEEEAARNQSSLMLKAKKMLQDWENKDPDVLKLWKTMNHWVYQGFEDTYNRMGISFDRFYYESETYLLGKDLIDEGIEKGVFFKKPDGSVWIDLTEDGLDQKLVLRSDGTSVYITQDLGTAQLKYEDYHMDKSIHVVGNEQDYHFKVLFLILEKLGKSWAKGLYHLSYGMVDLPSGKMKSREGTVVDADELMDQMENTASEQTEILGKTQGMSETEKMELYKTIGLGALKYFLLRVDPQKRLLFDPKESIDLQGNTGPFIQYSYARIQSILRKSKLDSNLFHDVKHFSKFIFEEKINPEERSLIKHLLEYEEIVKESAKLYSPAIVCTYLYELAKLFNHFYHLHSVLKEEKPYLLYFRLQLCEMTAQVIKNGMGLLGIEVPEKM